MSIDDRLFQQIRRQSRRQSVSVNDWLMAALFIAMETWMRDWKTLSSNSLLSVLMPFNLRPPEAIVSPASNQISFAVVARPPSGDARFEAICREISCFTRKIRSLRTSGLRKLIRAVHRVPGLLPVVSRYCMKSCANVVFSNLGDVGRLFDAIPTTDDGKWKFGQYTVERIRCAPPTRPQTHLAIVAMSYGGELHLMTRCEERDLAAQSIREFMQHFRTTLIDLAVRETGE